MTEPVNPPPWSTGPAIRTPHLLRIRPRLIASKWVSSPSPDLIRGLTRSRACSTSALTKWSKSEASDFDWRSSKHRPGIPGCPVNPGIKSGEGNDTGTISLRRKCFMRRCGTDQTGAAARRRGTDRDGRRKQNFLLIPVRVDAIPVPQKRFPAPNRTGNLPQALRIAARFCVGRRQNGPQQAEFRKIPCSFPCCQGIQMARRGRQAALTDARCCPA